MYCNNIANRYYRRPELLATFLILLVLKASLVYIILVNIFHQLFFVSKITDI